MARRFFSWLSRWLGSRPNQSHAAKAGRTQRKPHCTRLLLEHLEDRTLLSAPEVVPGGFVVDNVTQFSNALVNTFLGASFDKSVSIGGIEHSAVGDFGAQVSLAISGKAGLNTSFSGTGGTVSSNYFGRLAQQYEEPTGFGQLVSFNPENTNVTIVGDGLSALSATSPSFGYAASLAAYADATLGAQVGLFKLFNGLFNYRAGVDIPLMSVNLNNSGEASLLGLPIAGASPGAGLNTVLQEFIAGAENAALSRVLTFGLSQSPPLRLQLRFSQNDTDPQHPQLVQDLQLQLAPPKQLGPSSFLDKAAGAFISPSLGLDLGSLVEQAPVLPAVRSTAVQGGGVLTVSGQAPVAALNLQVGALIGGLFGLGALGTEISVNIGPASLQFTPVSFLLSPTLSVAQTISVHPVSLLTYTFTDSTGASMSPDVVLNGTDLGRKSSVSFLPGQDTLDVRFEGKPITVSPSWEFREVMTNVVDLNARLDATLTVGKIQVNLPGVDPIVLGPLYQQHFNFADTKLDTLLNTTTTILETTVTQGGRSLPSFTIGDTFKTSTVVTTTTDNNMPGAQDSFTGALANNSLRDAILAANIASSATTVIQLGAGIYNLTLPPSDFEDGANGNLLVTAPNVTIVGAGAGQTFIAANFPAGEFDRLFHVAPGAHLTLKGLTIAGGNAQASSAARGKGGAILQDANSILDIENCLIVENTADGGPVSGALVNTNGITGGAINSEGTLTVRNSTIRGNAAVGDGGGIVVRNGSVLIEGSTISGNTSTSPSGFSGAAANGGGLAAINSSVTIRSSTFSGNTVNGVLSGSIRQASGGGLFVQNTSGASFLVLILNSTFANNHAVSDPGVGGNGGAIFIFDQGQVPYMIDDTVVSNTASRSGAGVASGPGPIILKNTIVAGNLADGSSTPYEDDLFGLKVYSAGNNLIGATSAGALFIDAHHGLQFDGSTVTASSNGFDPTDLLNVSPQLGPLANYGGPTQTAAPLLGSRVIGKGGSAFNIPGVIAQLPANDQRGYARVSGGAVDIGAVQYQFDLALTGSAAFAQNSSTTINYTFTVTNKGPDAASNVTFTDFFPPHNTFAVGLPPDGWNLVNNNGNVTATDTNPLLPGESATFRFIVGPALIPPVIVSDTATVGPSSGDSNPANNQITLSLLDPQEGELLKNAVLFHFPSPGPTFAAGNFSAAVNWGDGGPGNGSLDRTGTVAVVASPNGGFDVIGSHTYRDEGGYVASVQVTGLTGAFAQANVAGKPVSGPVQALVPTPNGRLEKQVLFHFADSNPAHRPGDFNPFVFWADGSGDFAGPNLSVVANPQGGFDVVGSHTFASNVTAVVNYVQVPGPLGTLSGPSLLHLTDTALTSTDQVTVTWGDGTSYAVSGPSGRAPVFIVPNPAGGYDVAGYHAYTKAVTSLSGSALVAVANAPLTAGEVTPPRVVVQQQLTNAILYHFVDPNPALNSADFTATVKWGDGTSNTSKDGSGKVTIDPTLAGGFDVIGTHTYPASTVGAAHDVQVVSAEGRTYNNRLLFHFTDANPFATAADYTATVNWGDGTSNTSRDSSGSVTVVANPAGGFDVQGSHAYTQRVAGGFFNVQVLDAGGAFTSGSEKLFSVDYPLTAGALNLPAVSSEGESITNALLFHLTDTDPQGKASDFVATAIWGDGTTSRSTDGSGSVTVVANALGGYDVKGTHRFGDVILGSLYGVLVEDVAGASTGASSTEFAVADVQVVGTGGFSYAASESTDGPMQTVATFIDPPGTEALSDYSASIAWGDGAPASSGTISLDTGTGVFTVKGQHTYRDVGEYAIAVTLNHGQASPVQVQSRAVVSDVAVIASGNPRLNLVEGQAGGAQVLAAFMDPAQARSVSDYSATINWGDGTSSQGIIGHDRNAPFTYASRVIAGNEPSALSMADLDGNNALDMVVANARDNSIQVFLGNVSQGRPDGTFKTPAIYSLGTGSPAVLAIADVNGDGKLDIVSANVNNNTISILLGNGSGSFQAGQTLTTGASPSGVTAADLNGDGKADVVTANRGDNSISILAGNGDGTFRSPASLTTGRTPVAVTVGDLNGDTLPDLVVTAAGSGAIDVLLGAGGGNFTTRRTYQVGATIHSNPTIAVLAALTSSGKLDIVTSNAGSNEVSVLINKGDGTFNSAVQYATGKVPLALQVQDLDGDARKEIITANNGSNNVSVLGGNGDGTFKTAVNYALSAGASAPMAIAVGDINGEGVLDLVTANSLSNDITLLQTPYTVSGSHPYAQASGANPYAISVTVQHGGTTSAPVMGSAVVADAPLTAGALTPPKAVKGTPFKNIPVFHFTDANPLGAAGNFTAVVSLGDGKSVTLTSTPSSSGQIVAGPAGGFDVQLSYTYAINGTLTFSVTVYDTAGGRAFTDPGVSTVTASAMFNVINAPAITWNNPASIVYGTKLSGAQLNATASVAGTFVYEPAAGAVLSAGPHDLFVRFIPSDSVNNAEAAAKVTLSVTTAILTVTAPNPTRKYGTANPILTPSITGFVSTDTSASLKTQPTVDTSATAASNVGKYTITVSGASSPNYTIQYVPGTLTVTPAALTVTAQNSLKVYGSPNPDFSVTYSGFVLDQGSNVLGGMLTFATAAADESAPGNYAVTPRGLISTNYDIKYVAGNLTVMGNTAQVVTDAVNPGKSLLLVGGSPRNDHIVITPGSKTGTLSVTINGVTQKNVAAPVGTSFSRVLVFGGAGDDNIQVAGAVSVPMSLFGGSGDDRLNGGNGGNILIGGEGDDQLIGGNSRDLLVGGFGEDRLVGNGNADILIAGSTKYDNNTAALDAILAEWSSASSAAQRTQHLTGPVAGLNAVNGEGIFLRSGPTEAQATVYDDGGKDVLSGSAGQDWFWANLNSSGVRDKINDLCDSAFINYLAAIDKRDRR